jgi:bifunctional non-homologous end joining protein LigD
MKKEYRPMLATLVDQPFDSKDWLYETKWDGFRIVAEVGRGSVRLFSRNGIEVTARYPTIAQALRTITKPCVIDGELVALDAKGRSRFQLLQNALRDERTKLRYCVFDVLFLGGKVMRRKPLLERKALLKQVLLRNSLLRYSKHIKAKGTALFKKAKQAGLEGVMAKRAAGLYYSGKRTREWLKFKAMNEQEVVIAGYTAPRRSRKYFGALVLAVRTDSSWRYVGHAGTGFDEEMLRSLYENMQPLKTQAKPLNVQIKGEAHTTWLRPRLVGEVKFTEWTTSGEMRHPVFLGLRSDKKATDVIREMPASFIRL